MTPVPPKPAATRPAISPATVTRFTPGTRVRVIQQIPRLTGAMVSKPIDGVIIRFGQQKTGSWFAHAQDDKLWLDRLELRKDDGELIVLNLDQYTRVESI
jgi:hypothetical protein